MVRETHSKRRTIIISTETPEQNFCKNSVNSEKSLLQAINMDDDISFI